MKVLEKVVQLFSGRKIHAGMFAVLSPTCFIKGETKIVCELFKSGLQLYHLRKPRWAKEKVSAWIKDIPEKYRPRIVLHQFPELVSKYNLGGFHLAPGVPAPIGEIGELSAQCASYSDIAEIGRSCRYVMLGPVFQKEDHDPTVPARTAEEYSAIIDYWHKKNGTAKILAFGGVCKNNIKTCKELGFDGFATVGAIWDAPEGPVKAFKTLVKKW